MQSEVDLILKGQCSSVVHYNIKKIPISELPQDDEGLGNWLLERWREKDEALIQFYNQRNKSKRKLDASGGSRNLWVKDSGKQIFVLIFGFCFWMTVVPIWLWHMTWMGVVRCTLLFLILNYVYIYSRYGGLDTLLLDRWEIWKKRVSLHSHVV